MNWNWLKSPTLGTLTCQYSYILTVQIWVTVAFSCLVSSENKRDQRTIEQVLAESRAKKKLKTEHSSSKQSDEVSVEHSSSTENPANKPPVWPLQIVLVILCDRF